MDFQNEQLSQELQYLNRSLDKVDGDIPQQLGILVSYIQTLSVDSGRTDDYCSYILMLEEYAAKQKTESDRLLKLSELQSIKSDSLRYMLHLAMQLWETTDFCTEHYSVSVCPAEKMTVLVDIPTDELPDEYVKHSSGTYPNVKKIREALLCGIDVPGCILGETPYIISIEPEGKD